MNASEPTIHLQRLYKIGLLQVLLLGGTSWAGNDEGLEAFRRGNYAAALTEFSDAAKQGDSNALLNLSFMQGEGCGTAANPEESLKLMRQAAAANNPTAKFEVMSERMWSGGSGPEPSRAEFAQVLRDAAEQGFPLAMFVFAQYYERLATPPDPFRAYVWYSLAARRAKAETAIGTMEGDSARVASKFSPEERARGNELIEQLDRETPHSKLIPLSACSAGAGVEQRQK